VGPRAGMDGRKISSLPGLLLPTYFYSGTLRTFQHICNSYCQHQSCSQNAHSTRDIITPHTTVPFGPLLFRTLHSYNSHILPAPSLHTAQECKFGALCGPCTTESHPIHHLKGQGPLMLACLHALVVHSPYSHGSISVPLLLLPNPVTSVTPTLPLHGVSFLWARGHRISR
jgi:hypothetical protein